MNDTKTIRSDRQKPSAPKTWRGPPGVLIEPTRRMRGEGFDWDHEIQIALPVSYTQANKTYPVLRVTDGSYYFETAVSIVNVYSQKQVPEMIVVGIGIPPEASGEYHIRPIYEFTPNDGWGFRGFGSQLFERESQAMDTRLKADGVPLATRYGGASEFLTFLGDIVRPARASDYRTTDEHTIFGDSAGGIFCTYALLAQPTAFNKYICGSPALHWGNCELFRVEEQYAQMHKDLPAKVFFGAGEGEIVEGEIVSAYGIVSSTTRMAEIVKMRAYPSLKLHARIFRDEDHDSVVPLNLSWGLRTLWEGEVNKSI